MSPETSTSAPTRTARLKRPALLVSAGLVALGLAVAGPVAVGAAAVPLPPTVTLSAATASPTGQVTLTADGFAPDENLTFAIDAQTLPVYNGDPVAKTDAQGHYSGAAIIPEGVAAGAHTVTVTGATSTLTASTPIQIVAQPTSAVSPATIAVTAYASSGVTATFSGFAPGSTVSFSISTTRMGDPAGTDVVVGASGTATLHYTPTAGSPYAGPGTYYLGASAASGTIRAAYVTYQVAADAPAAPPAPPVAGPATPVKKAASFTG